MGLGVRLSLSMRGLIGSKEEDHPTLRGLECSQGIEDDDAVLMCNERNTPVRGLTLQSDSMNNAPANMGWITCIEEASGFVGVRVRALDQLSARSRLSLRSPRDVRSVIERGLMMEYRDMCRGLRPEGVCVLVGAETKKKKTHRNSEKGTDIGMRFVLFACLASEGRGLTRSRGRPCGQSKGRWVELCSSGARLPVGNG